MKLKIKKTMKTLQMQRKKENEEHYWIRAYNDEVEDPIVITVYKK